MSVFPDVAATTPPSERPAPTMADLTDLLKRMHAGEERMSSSNPNRALLGEASWWLVNLAKRCIELERAATALAKQAQVVT